MVSSDHIAPGEEGQIEVTINTQGKTGLITKTVQVRTNDPKKFLHILKLTALVVDNFHNKEYPPEEIFNSPCKKCHVDKGIGRKGAYLFWADCLMCHQRGKIAPSIEKLKRLPERKLKKSIENGIPNTKMPGFLIDNGGPLLPNQILSLIKYIKNQ